MHEIDLQTMLYKSDKIKLIVLSPTHANSRVFKAYDALYWNLLTSQSNTRMNGFSAHPKHSYDVSIIGLIQKKLNIDWKVQCVQAVRPITFLLGHFTSSSRLNLSCTEHI